MINEAARVMAERVVEAPEDVDFGMVVGTGWPPFRGGPLRYADARGIRNVLCHLENLARDIAPHFEPCDYLRGMAEQGLKFYSTTRPRPSVGIMRAPVVMSAPATVVQKPEIIEASKPSVEVRVLNSAPERVPESRSHSEDPSSVPEAV
jgi:3-hydroxyacyl-CoA dehydrogenase/enoyl-CoA hydratase/3-hydroxybutyryl-CoA epimerase